MGNGLVDAMLDRVTASAANEGDPLVVYLAHPVGKEHEREINLGYMQQWFVWLVEHTDWCIVVPWFVYVSNLDELTHRERGIRDDLAVLRRCDAVVLCGREVSHGMQTEKEEADRRGLPVLDLTAGHTAPPQLGPLAGRVLTDMMAMRRMEVGSKPQHPEFARG